ncbi:TraR/DksA family transcriptional regulator [Nocardia araoensis]|uniref:TraR/DksA family transcriptional regulator n=1 Tax=Nocardia araoensis TaxID=228600 RepID=UPI0012F6B9AB|nr:TraR/DksA C4-type zinc finger protein [Nocardia araoensis]
MTHAYPVQRASLSEHLPVLRAALEQQRRFRLQQLAELQAELDRAGEPADAADAARHEVDGKLAAAARQAPADIEAALLLIAAGRYGRCRRCHAEIPIRLLRTIPTTQWCLRCHRHLSSADGSRVIRGQRPARRSRSPRRGLPTKREALACR